MLKYTKMTRPPLCVQYQAPVLCARMWTIPPCCQYSTRPPVLSGTPWYTPVSQTPSALPEPQSDVDNSSPPQTHTICPVVHKFGANLTTKNTKMTRQPPCVQYQAPVLCAPMWTILPCWPYSTRPPVLSGTPWYNPVSKAPSALPEPQSGVDSSSPPPPVF